MAINTAHTQRLGKVASYLKNVGKSVGYATIEVMKGTNPSMAEFADTNRELFKEVYSATVNYKQTLKKAEVSIKRSKLYTAADTGLKAIKEDLKTGQFYNKKRESELELASMGEDFSDLDFDNFDFGDIGGDDDDNESVDHSEFIAGQKADNVRTEFMAKANDRSIMAGAKLTSTTVANSAEFLAATSRANTRLMYIQNQNMIETMGTGFTSLKMGIDAIVNGLSGPLKTHMENSKTFYETTTKIHQENNAILKEILEMQRNLYKAKDEEYKRSAYDDIVGSEGTPDLREYAKQLKKNMKSVLGPEMETLFGNSLGENSNLLMAFVGSPLKFLPVMLMQTVIPATVRTAMKSLDEGFSTLFTNFITRMNKMKKSESPLFSTLGKLFGLNIESKKSVDPSKFNRGNMSWNGIAQKTLVDVIPGYLRKIEAHLSGGEENIFDYGTGRWKKASKVKKEYDDIRKGAINSATGDLQEVLIDAVKKLQVDSFAQQKSMLDQIQKFMAKLYDEGGGLRFTSKKADAESLDDTYRDLFNDDKFADYIFKVIAKNKSIARRLDENIINARQSEARQKRDIETYGGTAINLFNDSLDFKHDKKYGKIKNPGLVDKSGHDALFYLRNILGELMYQREHGVKTIGGGGTGGSGKGRRRRGRGPSPAPVPAPETVDIEKYVTGKIGKASYLTKEEQEERKAKEKEENAYKGGWFDPDAGYADSHYRAVLAHTKAKKSDDEEKDTALSKWLQKKLNDRKERLNANGDPFLEQLLQAGSLGQKWRVIQDGIAKLTMKPASFLSGVLVKADEQLFNLMFNTKALDPDADLKNKDGKKVKGLVDYMITRTKESFDKLNDYIDEHILDPLKKKFAPLWDKLKEKAKPYGKAIKEKFKWAGGKVKGAMSRAYGPLWNKAKNSEVVQRLKNGEVMTDEQIAEAQYRHNVATQTQDALQAFYNPDKLPEQAQVDEDEQQYLNQYSFMANSARGRYVRHTGLTMVSPGEMIIPASFNKKIQNRQLRNENRMKSRISKMLFSRNIGNHAEGTVANPNDNPSNSKASKTFTDTALSVASNVTGASPEKVKQIISTVDEEAPDVVASGALGGALGLLVGSPLLGAAAGVATSIVGKSKTLQGILFGSDEQDDGLFSKALQEKFKAVSGDLETYGIAGAVTGMITPLGPVAGLAVGSAIALAKNNVQFMAKMFGKLKDDGTRDETGLIKPDLVNNIKKAAPKMAVGAAAGMMLGPFGLVGNLLLGSGLGFASTTNKFKELLLGKEDEKGDREGGLAGIIRKSVVEPLKASMKTFKEEGIEFFKKNVLAPLRDFVDPFTQMVKNTITSIGDKVSDTLNSIFERTIGVPLHEAFENILKKITGGVTKLIKGLLFVPKAMISAPFKALGGIGNTIRNSQINRGTASDMTAADRLAFRQKHRFRNRFSKWTGADKTYELDSMMANMSDDRTSALYDLVCQYVDQGKWSDTRRRDEINGAGDALVTYLNENKDDKGRSLMDSIGFKASKDIRRAIASGDTEIFRKTLANTKGLSATHQNAIFDQLMQSVGAINNYSNMRNLGAKKRSELEKDISKITGTKINSKMIKNLYRNLKTEVKANKEKKAAEEKEDKDGIKRPNFDNPDMAKLSDVLQANANKTADRLIETFGVTNKLLKIIAEHEVGKIDFYDGTDKKSVKTAKEILKSDVQVAGVNNKKSNINRGLKANDEANFSNTAKNSKISFKLTNAFGGYEGTIKDFTALPNGRINQVLFLKNSIDSSAVEFMLTIDDSEFDNYAKIAKAINFKLTSTDCDNIRDNLTKTGANLVLKVSKTGYKIKDIKSLIEIMNNIKSNDQIRLIKNYIKTTGIVPETAHDLIEASKPSSIPSGAIKKKRKRKNKPTASSLTGSMNNVEKDQQEMSPDEGGGNAAVNANGGLRASRSVVNKTNDVLNKTDNTGITMEVSPHGHIVKYGANGEPLDDKSSQEGMRDFEESENREKELAESSTENATGVKSLLSKLFGKQKQDDSETKKKGLLSRIFGERSFIGSGVGKIIKFLGVGGTVAIGASLTGHLAHYWAETVWPSLKENVLPKLSGMIIGTEDENGNLQGGLRGLFLGNKTEDGEWDGTGLFPTLGKKIETGVEKITGSIAGIWDWAKEGGIKDLFQNRLFPMFLEGLTYFNQYMLAPLITTIIRSLPSIGVAVVKGIKDVFTMKGMFNRKMRRDLTIDVSAQDKDVKKIASEAGTRSDVYSSLKAFSMSNVGTSTAQTLNYDDEGNPVTKTSNSSGSSNSSYSASDSIRSRRIGNQGGKTDTTTTSSSDDIHSRRVGNQSSENVSGNTSAGGTITVNGVTLPKGGDGSIISAGNSSNNKKKNKKGLLNSILSSFGWIRSDKDLEYLTDANGERVLDENGDPIITTEYDTNNHDDTLLSQTLKGSAKGFFMNAAGMSNGAGALANILNKFSLKKAAKGAVSSAAKGGKVGIIGGALKGIGKTIGGALTGAAKLGEKAHNWAILKVTGKAGEVVESAASAATDNKGLMAKITKGIVDFVTGLGKNSKLISKISDFMANAFGKEISETALGKAFESLANKLVSKIGNNLASNVISKAASNIASLTPAGAIIWAGQFIAGAYNAELYFHSAEPLNWGYKILGGIINIINNKVTLGLIPTETVVDCCINTILPALGLDTSGLQNMEDESVALMDQWNKEHPDDQYTNLEDFLKKDKITTKIGNFIFGKKNSTTGEREGGLFGKKVDKSKDSSSSTTSTSNSKSESSGRSGAFGRRHRHSIGGARAANTQNLNIQSSMSKMMNVFNSSNPSLSTLNSINLGSSGEDSLDNSTSSIFSSQKISLIPTVLFKSGWNLINNYTSSLRKSAAMVSKLSYGASTSDNSKIKTALKNAINGNGIFNEGSFWSNSNYSSYGIFKNILNASTLIQKLFAYPIGLFNKIFKRISSSINSVKTKTSTEGDTIWDWVKNLFTNSDDKANSDENSDDSGTGRGRRRTGGARVYQEDPAIANMKFGSGSKNNTIRDAGCGPVAATNLINSLGGNMDIGAAANYAVNRGYKTTNGGTDMNYFNDILGSNGYSTSNSTRSSDVSKSLREGKPVVMLGNDGTIDGPFGDRNHFITAKGYDRNGNIVVDDPDNPNGNLAYPANQVLSNMQDSVIVNGYGRRRRGYGRGAGFGSEFPKYNLSASQKKDIATMITGETGGTDLTACMQEASQLANLNEVQYGKSATPTNLINSLHGGWYAKSSWTRGCTDTAMQAVEQVLVQGKRVLPRYVVEHDTFPNDIKNAKSRSSYKRGDSVSNIYGSNYKFYDFFGASKNGDIAGYFDSYYKKYKDDQPYGVSSTGTASSNGDSSSSGTSTLFTSLANLGKSVLKGVYGEDVYNAFFGSESNNATDDGSTSSDGAVGNGSLESFVQTALNEEGYKEKRSNSNLDDKTANAGSANWTKYGPLTNNPSGPWCASFVSWAANQAGIPASTIPRSASVADFTSFYKKQNRWSGRNATPKRGDIVTFGSSGSSHIGIVTGVQGNSIKTIEGNTSNMVAQRSYTKGDSYIYGYGSPNAAAATGTSGMDGTSGTTNAYGRRHRFGFGIVKDKEGNENNDAMLKNSKFKDVTRFDINAAIKNRNANYIANGNNNGTGRRYRGNGGAGSGSIDYTQVLASIVNVLLSISNNTEVLNKIMTILSEKLGVSVSSNDVQSVAKSAADTADAKAKLTQLLNNQKTTSSGVTSLLNNSSTEYLVKAMEAIAAQ